MTRQIASVLAAFAAVFMVVAPAWPCSICGGSLQTRQTLRQDAAQAKLVLYGTLDNPRLAGGGATGGTTDLKIKSVLKSDPFLGKKEVVELPRYVPVNPQAPPQFLVFCDVFNGKLDPYRGLPVQSAAVADYLKGALALDGKDRTQQLLYYFQYLDHRDTDVAFDAFLEFAKSSDQEVGRVARKLAPDRLRQLIQDPRTPAERLGLFSLLLGACGGEKDAALLRGMIEKPNDQAHTALGGLLSGYIELKPREGWELAHKLLGNERRPFTERLSVLGTLRFYHGWKPDDSRRDVLKGLAVLLPQGDIADLAVEDLRRWQLWDLTTDVLALYGKKSHDAPILQRALLRYALSCPKPEADRFVAQRRKEDPELIKDIEESMQFEKQK